MKTAKLFKNGQSQAVRLPKEFRFSGEKVLINGLGRRATPTARSWDALIESLDKFPPDFMTDREQPVRAEQRNAF